MRIYRVEEIEILPDCREVRRGSEVLHLRPKAVDLLLYLVANRDRVLSKQELLDEVWKGTNVTENSLTQCVIELRRGLGDDAQQQRFVKTVARTGYRFVGRTEEIEHLSPVDPRPCNPSGAELPAAAGSILPVRSDWRGQSIVLTAGAILVIAMVVLLVRGHEREEPALMTSNLEAYRYYAAGVTKAQNYHTKEALELLQKAVSLDPKFAMAIARIGYTDVIAAEHPEIGKPYLEKAMTLSTGLSEPNRLYLAAWYAMATADFDGAIRTFRELLARYPLEIEAYCGLTSLLMAENRLKEAYDAIQGAIQVDPASAQSYNILRAVLLDMGRFDDAIIAARRFVLLAATEANAHDSLGLAYEAKGDFEASERCYRTALELHPDFEIALVHLGNSLYRQGRYADATSAFEKYLKGAASENERRRAYDYIGRVHLRRGDIVQAQSAVAKASSGVPVELTGTAVLLAIARKDFARADALISRDRSTGNRGTSRNQRAILYLLGRIALGRGESEEALGYFRQAIKTRPPLYDIEWYEDCLADGYLELGRTAEAIAEYKRVVQLYPHFALAWYHLSQAYEQAGDSTSALHARKYFSESWKNADPNIPELISARRRMAIARTY